MEMIERRLLPHTRLRQQYKVAAASSQTDKAQTASEQQTSQNAKDQTVDFYWQRHHMIVKYGGELENIIPH